jgi:hypothetical protein
VFAPPSPAWARERGPVFAPPANAMSCSRRPRALRASAGAVTRPPVPAVPPRRGTARNAHAPPAFALDRPRRPRRPRPVIRRRPCAGRESLAARAGAPRSCAACATSLTAEPRVAAVLPAGPVSPPPVINLSQKTYHHSLPTSPRRRRRSRETRSRPFSASVTPTTPTPSRPAFTRSRSWSPQTGAAAPASRSALSPRRAHAPTASSTVPKTTHRGALHKCHSRPRGARDPPPSRPRATITAMPGTPADTGSFVASIVARSLIRRTTAGSRPIRENGGLTALRALLPAFRHPHIFGTLGQVMISARCASRSGGHAPRASGAA